ncbi:hypothetical protein H9645_06190 [Luteimonas sp. Sa2BVA3]|uniref:Integrase n=1 Tax=Luteimonas colneyensis TaxID=2762230 RepID=A0ABR8UHW7_9GAMM|nr:hypothetical protein [Luteimonas colneyensis]MBD7987617.1 hypothetical protein [Luteimonas colneyensis]
MAYTDLLLERVEGSRSIPGYIRKDVGLFAHLDRHFESASKLTNVRLAQLIGPREMYRYQRACGYLVSSGLIESLSNPEVSWALTSWRVCTLKAELRSEWAQDALDSFQTHLLERRSFLASRGHRRTREPMTPKGVLSAMYGATHLLKTAEKRGGTTIQDITQRDIQALLSQSNLVPNRLGRFVAYLNTETPRFHRLKLPRIGGSRGLPDGILSADAYEDLIQILMQADSPPDRALAIVSLLCLLYGQAPYRVLRLRREQARLRDELWEVQFAQEWVPLDPDVSQRMAVWMDTRREFSVVEATDASPFLFPGRRAGSPLSTDTLHAWLRPYGVKPQQLQSSSIAQLVQSEAFHPSVATGMLGLTRTCVTKYVKALAPAHLKLIDSLVPTS